MLDHYEGFELEKEYMEIWNSIRYEKVDELYALTEEIIKLLDSHIDDKLLFHMDYMHIQDLFKKMKRKNYFYMSASAKKVIVAANPKFRDVFKDRKCVRDLKYTGESNKNFKNGKIYRSLYFNGGTYVFKINGKDIQAGCLNFERIKK